MYIPTDKNIIFFFHSDGYLTEDEKSTGYKESGYYFWLETWCHVEGPYKTKEEADEGLGKYIKSLGYN